MGSRINGFYQIDPHSMKERKIKLYFAQPISLHRLVITNLSDQTGSCSSLYSIPVRRLRMNPILGLVCFLALGFDHEHFHFPLEL